MEIRDLYDFNRNLTGMTIAKGDPIPSGYYFMTVVIFMQNSSSQFLIQKRSVIKGSKYGTTGGHPTAGETSYLGLLQEVKEEIGLDLKDYKIELYKTLPTNDNFIDMYYVSLETDPTKMVLQEEEVESISWMTKDEIFTLIKEGQFMKSHALFFNDCLEYLDSQHK